MIANGLSTKAIRHTAIRWKLGNFRLSLAVSALVVTVTDDGSTATTPRAKRQDQNAKHGRGLGMVSALAHRFVVHDTDRGHTVTAELYADIRSGGQ
ncbi:ATP-binding protein [Streptomyces sp. PRKS01-65]|nr:ATP-binding protein [Streptomyces harenosi]